MKLPDKWYDILKWIVVIFLPALNTLIFALGNVLDFDSKVVCGIISAITVFLGALIGVSTHSYKKGLQEEDDE